MYRNDSIFAALPAQISSRMSELAEHEYWGAVFAEGNSEYALIQKENGRHVLCITWGKWNFSKGVGDVIALEHTQTRRVNVEGRIVAIVNKDNVERHIAKYGDKKIPTWTLK